MRHRLNQRLPRRLQPQARFNGGKVGQIQRRRFLLATSALLAAPFARAQPVKSSVRRIGFLLQQISDPGPAVPGPQRQGSQALRKLGWIEGENLIIERAFADEKFERLPGLAEGLLRKGVEVLATNGPESTL